MKPRKWDADWHEPISAINPAHYRSGDMECIDAIEAALEPDEYRGFLKGNVFKYMWRERGKGGDEDVSKALWYVSRLASYSPPTVEIGEAARPCVVTVHFKDSSKPRDFHFALGDREVDHVTVSGVGDFSLVPRKRFEDCEGLYE